MFSEPLGAPGADAPAWYETLQPFFSNMLDPVFFWSGVVIAVMIMVLLCRRRWKQ